MHASFILSGLCLAASAFAQAVSEGIAPTATAPAGCKPTFAGNFTLNVLDISFGVKKAAGAQILASAITVTLKEGILHDSLGRTGAIVENHQFQFDGPPQAGSIYTGGWSACANDSLALGGTTIFYACTSGEFRNLYDEHIGDQCSPINIIIVPVGGTASSSSISSAPTPSATPSSSASDLKSEIVTDSKSASNFTVSSFSPLKTVTGKVADTPTASVSTELLVATTGSSTGSLLASEVAASTSSISTGGAAVTTLGAARNFLGAAVGAFGAAFIML